MATIDLTRHATVFRKHYAGVRMQQGRVLSDDDFNEAWRIDLEDMRRTRVHVIGASGSPDGGFRIGNPTVSGGVADFTIGTGTLYLGGLRLQMDPPETYRTQKDWLRQAFGQAIPVPANNTTRHDLVWLEAWMQEVSAVEDSELLEVALSGPDTSARVRNMRRIFVQTNVGTVDCKQAWSTLVASWASQGTLTQQLEFATDATLTVSLDPAGGSSNDLCSPPVTGGYLGAENQAIRVQLTDTTHFTWGFDNAAPLYRVQVETLAGQRRVIKLLTEPKDQAHWPLAGQIVEILPWSAVLLNRVLSSGNLQDCEKLAELSGHLARVDGSYDPNTQRFTIAAANQVPLGFGEEWMTRPDAAQISAPGDAYFYMRVWNRGADITSALEIPFVPGTPVALQNTGLLVTINGTQRRQNDFWIIAARPETPDQVVPWQLDAGRSPHGYRRYRTPLAVVRWQADATGNVTGTVIDDCRDTFLPLTRIRSCCTYTVGDGVSSQGHFNSIQEAINALPPAGGEVCVLPGIYTENIIIQDKQNITLHGCGPRSRITSKVPTGGGSAAPVIQITHSERIRIALLALVAHSTGPGVLVSKTPLSQDITLHDLLVNGAARSAIEVQGGSFITIRNCRVLMSDVASPWPGVFVTADDVSIEDNVIQVQRTSTAGTANVIAASAGRGGLQIGGTSERVRVIDNLIEAGIGNGITLGTLEQVDANGSVIGLIGGWLVDADDPCAPGNVYVPPATGGGEGTPTYRSSGPLYDILIEKNRILDMGLNGIGVVAFFNLEAQDEFITVEGLRILGNEIRGCLKRPLANIDADMIDAMGFGSIALADVENLVIQHNLIEDNGPNHLEPVCGIFVLHAEGMDISDNRIVNNGAKTNQPAHTAKDGRRGGINIVLAIAPTVPTPIGGQLYPNQNGVPAAKIHDNIVSQPLGQALSLMALGSVSVANNHFTSRGMVLKTNPPSPSFIAATIAIINLGLSNEGYAQLTTFSGVLYDSVSPQSGPTLSSDAVLMPREDLDDKRIGQYLANGNVLFTDNRCDLNLLETGLGFALSSIVIFSLDDIGFHDNQCDCNLLDDFVIVQAVLFGWTVRVSDNRFKEGIFNALYSALTIGLMNATSNNQSTHCLLVSGLIPSLKVDSGNKALIDGLYPGFCERLRTGLGHAGFTIRGLG